MYVRTFKLYIEVNFCELKENTASQLQRLTGQCCVGSSSSHEINTQLGQNEEILAFNAGGPGRVGVASAWVKL